MQPTGWLGFSSTFLSPRVLSTWLRQAKVRNPEGAKAWRPLSLGAFELIGALFFRFGRVRYGQFWEGHPKLHVCENPKTPTFSREQRVPFCETQPRKEKTHPQTTCFGEA